MNAGPRRLRDSPQSPYKVVRPNSPIQKKRRRGSERQSGEQLQRARTSSPDTTTNVSSPPRKPRRGRPAASQAPRAARRSARSDDAAFDSVLTPPRHERRRCRLPRRPLTLTAASAVLTAFHRLRRTPRTRSALSPRLLACARRRRASSEAPAATRAPSPSPTPTPATSIARSRTTPTPSSSPTPTPRISRLFAWRRPAASVDADFVGAGLSPLGLELKRRPPLAFEARSRAGIASMTQLITRLS